MTTQPAFGTLENHYVLNASKLKEGCVKVFGINKKDSEVMYARMCNRLFDNLPLSKSRLTTVHHFRSVNQFLSWFMKDRIDLNDDTEVFSNNMKKVNPNIYDLFSKSFPNTDRKNTVAFLNYLLEVSKGHLRGDFIVSLSDPLGDIL